jgi:cholesterol oxidase
LDAAGKDAPGADGSNGYRVYFWDLRQSDFAEQRKRIRDYRDLPSVLAKRVILSAGSLGSTELLLRNKLIHQTLPAISDQLGNRFSGNGDFLAFGWQSETPTGPNYGPVITQSTDYNLYKDFNRERAFLLEDAAYPSLGAWFLEAIRPQSSRLRQAVNVLVDFIKRWISGMNTGRVGGAVRTVIGDTATDRMVVLLHMGVDKADGVMSLGSDQRLRLKWPYKNSMILYKAILASGVEFCRAIWARIRLPLLTWEWPFRRNVSVHALGGCVLAPDKSRGVTDSSREHFGEVFGYRGLYVMDGAIVPTALGSNPTATISALCEMAAEGITGNMPTAELLPSPKSRI